jgi:hypothetical protein
LGIGDWAQSPIPNPHIKEKTKKYLKIIIKKIIDKSIAIL